MYEKNYRLCALFLRFALKKDSPTLTKNRQRLTEKNFIYRKKVTNIYNGINKTIEQNAADYNVPLKEDNTFTGTYISPEKV